jgi:outer membrane protein assembly factor BamB
VADDGTIYFGTWRGLLVALTPEGRQKWTFRAGNELKSSPAVDERGVVYLGSRDTHVYAINPDGSLKWRFATSGWVDSSPALSHSGTIYFGSWDKGLYAVDSSGQKVWRFATDGPVDSSPAIGKDETVYFGSHDKILYALLPDGRQKWRFKTGGAIVSSPALNEDGSICITSMDGWMYLVQPDGTLKWRLHTGGTGECSPVVGADGVIYIGVELLVSSGTASKIVAEFWAVSPDGKPKWRAGGDNRVDSSALVLDDGLICTVSRSGYLRAMSPIGDRVWSINLMGFGYGSPTVGKSGAFYSFESRPSGNCLSAFHLQNTLALSSWPKFRGNLRNTGNALDCPPAAK